MFGLQDEHEGALGVSAMLPCGIQDRLKQNTHQHLLPHPQSHLHHFLRPCPMVAIFPSVSISKAMDHNLLLSEGDPSTSRDHTYGAHPTFVTHQTMPCNLIATPGHSTPITHAPSGSNLMVTLDLTRHGQVSSTQERRV